ncbi:MAG: glutamate racemase [Candidatus Hamiltonella defensa (Ceratovacuna japonica)]
MMTSQMNFYDRVSVLILDSGIGGLSVYQEMKKLLPHIHYIYCFDNEGFPYGEKSEIFISEQIVKIMTAIQKKHFLNCVIIACNTASTIVLPILRQRFSFPVIGAVPAIKPAARITRNGVLGLLATPATIKRPYTLDLIKRFAKNCQVELLGSSELVYLAEKKVLGTEISINMFKKILQPWLNLQKVPDTIVLGCTHFPFIINELQQIFLNASMIHSGAAIAKRAFSLIGSQQNTSVHSFKNKAYCVKKNGETESLSPILEKYGFSVLEELSL